jgi:hypothetical protein
MPWASEMARHITSIVILVDIILYQNEVRKFHHLSLKTEIVLCKNMTCHTEKRASSESPTEIVLCKNMTCHTEKRASLHGRL